MNAGLRDPFRDSLVTFKSIVLFSVLTVLNISVFVFMVFENQTDLIARNAELESKDKGIVLKVRMEEILAGRAPGPGADFSPGREYGRLQPEDIRKILDALEAEGVSDYTVFMESGLILADSRGRRGGASARERELIRKSIFRNSFENLTFDHDVDMRSRTVDLYIPVTYGADRLFVIRPTIPMRYVDAQTRFLYRQCVLIGLLVLLVHILFVVLNQRMIIRPMVRARTEALSEKNRQIQSAKDELEKTFNEIHRIHAQVQKELDIARKIQLSLIPEKIPQAPGYGMHVHYSPASKVGGDFYDFYPIDGEHLGVLLADASGHGIPAAFVVSMAKMSFSRHARGNLSPADVFASANRELEAFISASAHYLTAVYLIIHLPTGRIRYTQASHPAPLHYGAGSRSIVPLKVEGLFLGMFEDSRYENSESVLEKGDRLLLYTDGLNEAGDPNTRTYGKEPMNDLLLKQGARPGKEILDALIGDFHGFMAGRPFEDDVTAILIERN